MSFGMQMLLGSGRPTVKLNASYTPSADATSPTNALAQFGLENDGDIVATGGTNTVTDIGDWLTPKAFFSQFECRLTQNSGTALGGSALSTWLNLGTTRTWTLARNTDGTNTAGATLEVGYAGLNTAIKTATLTFTANRFAP
jgi:hypothetical protein